MSQFSFSGNQKAMNEKFNGLPLDQKLVLIIAVAFDKSGRNGGAFNVEDVQRLWNEYTLGLYTEDQAKNLARKVINEEGFAANFLSVLDN